MRRLVILLVLAIPIPALAGGTSWLFRVKSVSDLPGGGQRIELLPQEPVTDFPNKCQVITVHLQYAPPGPPYPRVSRDGYQEALAVLKSASQTGFLVRFGSMGSGLSHEGFASACEVASRALAVVEEYDGQRAVYSYFKWP